MANRRSSELTPAEEKIHSFVYTLLYPASLGAFIVLLVIQGFAELDALELGHALFLVTYFSALHIQNVAPKKYSVRAFIFDLIEIAIMFQLFTLLGLIPAIVSHDFGLDGITAILLWTIAVLLLPTLSRLVDSWNSPATDKGGTAPKPLDAAAGAAPTRGALKFLQGLRKVLPELHLDAMNLVLGRIDLSEAKYLTRLSLTAVFLFTLSIFGFHWFFLLLAWLVLALYLFNVVLQIRQSD